MKVYLCGRYSRRDELRGVRGTLAALGHTCTSRWLNTTWEGGDGSGSSAAPPEYRQRFAVTDLEDVARADVLVAFTEPPNSGGRGGRHVELGAALALGKRVIVVGHYENLFCHHPLVEFVKDKAEMASLLGRAY